MRRVLFTQEEGLASCCSTVVRLEILNHDGTYIHSLSCSFSLSLTHTETQTIQLILCHKLFHFRVVKIYHLIVIFLHFLLFYVQNMTVLESYFIIMCCHAELMPGGKFLNFKAACSLLKYTRSPQLTFFRRLSKMILFN